MKPKIFEDYCKEHSLLLVRVIYKYRGVSIKRPGWDICKPNGEIVLSVEPKRYYDGTKWFVRHLLCKMPEHLGIRYFKRISKDMLSDIDLNLKSSFYNSAINKTK